MPGPTGHLLPGILPGSSDAVLDYIGLNAKAAGNGVHVYLALDGIRDIGHGICYLVY